MSADLFSNFIGMTLQATGNNNNAWGTILNGSALQTIEKAIAGNVSHAVTGGTLDLSGSPPPAAQTQVLELLQIFTGVLTSNQIVKVPNLSKFWLIDNQTTGAFQLLFQTPSGTFVNIPQGTTKFVFCDGAGNLVRLDKDQVGNFEFNSIISPGTMECTGASLLRADFPDLFAKIGVNYGSADSLHFTLPLTTDTGRFLRSRSGSLAVGTYQSNQNLAHTHTVTGAPDAGTLGTNSAGAHQHGVFLHDGGHTHAVSGGVNGTASGPAGVGTGAVIAMVAGQAIIINSATTGVTVGSVSGTGANDNLTASAGAHTHTISGVPGIGSLGTASQGGAEARPESLAVIIVIRY